MPKIRWPSQKNVSWLSGRYVPAGLNRKKQAANSPRVRKREITSQAKSSCTKKQRKAPRYIHADRAKTRTSPAASAYGRREALVAIIRIPCLSISCRQGRGRATVEGQAG